MNRLMTSLLLGSALLTGCAAQTDDDRDDEERASTAQVSGMRDAGVTVTDGGGRLDGSSATPSDGGAASACASLTYESFGKPFLTKYCTGCHTGARAPDGIDLSTLAGAKKDKSEIMAHAVRTPRSKPMPPATSPQPTADERAKLGEWLNCGPN